MENPMEIGTISVSRMNNGAHFEFMTIVVKMATEDQAVNGFCNQALNKVREALRMEEEVLVRSNKSPLTKEIAKADSERDRMYSTLKRTASAWRNVPQNDVAQAAENVFALIETYRISGRDQYDKQSGLLENLLIELQGAYRNDVQKIGMEQVVNVMRTANNNVRDLLIRRSREEAGRETGRVRAARKNTDDAYILFVKVVNAHSIMNGGREFDAFIGTMNQLIIRYKEQVLKQPSGDPEASANDPVAMMNLNETPLEVEEQTEDAVG